MHVLTSLSLAARGVLLIAGLLGPGAMMARALQIRATVGLSFVASVVALYATVVTYALCRIPINLATLVAGLAVITTLSFALAPRGKRPAPFADEACWRPFSGLGAWAPLYLLFWGLILLRAIREPLAGPDVGFRWSFLAEQMLRFESLDFYPPRAAEHFVKYFWAESIPPGVSAVHAWAYACAGNTAANWTIPAVLLQFWALHDLLWRAAYRLAGIDAARYACLAAASTPLLTWSLLLAQETGFTALALVGIVAALVELRATQAARWAVVAALCAGLGASAREYGLVFPVIASAGLALVTTRRRPWLAFTLVALPLCLAWPLRVAFLTGNPVFSLSLGGLPVNPRFAEWTAEIKRHFGGTFQSVAGWQTVGRYFFQYAPAAVLGGIAIVVLAARRRRDAVFAAAVGIVLLGLWAASVPYTTGGLFYTMRVVSPALALGALAAGWAMSAAPKRPAVRTAFAVLIGFGLPATLALPANPWRTPPRDWPGLNRSGGPSSDPMVPILLRTGAVRIILADAPGLQRDLQSFGVAVVPLWSPEADWLFEPDRPRAEAERRWQDSGIHYFVLTKNPLNLAFFNAHLPRLHPAFRFQRAAETDFQLLLRLELAPEP
jgi:hypothetical protein